MSSLINRYSALRFLYSTSFCLIFFLCLCCKSAKVYSAVYYFSALNGNDQHSPEQAKNPLTAWKTLDKLNKFFPSLSGGDSVLFKRGETFYGTIQVNKSGALFAPIYIGAYGLGEEPVISGFTTLYEWKSFKPGVYESIARVKGKNVIINGKHQPMGRFPNEGYFSYETHIENKSISDRQLSSAINWAGAELVIRKNRWTIDRSLITSHSATTVSYETGNKAIPTKGYGYFFQNDIRTLDQLGEWYSDQKANKLYMYFGKDDPGNYQVMTSTATDLVEIKGFNNIIFENLHFTGAGSNTFKIVNARKISLRNIRIDYSGTEAILASYSPFLTVENCLIRNSWSGGVNLDAGCTNARILQNHISRVGLAAGMGRSGTGTYEGITAFGDFTEIQKNKIDNIGYNGIYFGGNASIVKNNFISFFCLTKDDGAGIYVGDWSKTFNKKVEGNIIANGIGNNTGTGLSGALMAEGIYIDDNSQSVKISNNTIFACVNNGIKIHNAKDILISRNTVFNNGVQLRLEQDCYLPSSSLIRNNNVQGNIFFSKGPTQSNASYSSHADDINDFGRIDSNFYNLTAVKSLDVCSVINLGSKSTERKHTIFSWMELSGNDKSSVEILAEFILFEYNPENKTKTISLSQDYTDVYKNIYKHEIVLAPYSSVVLFPVNSNIKGANSSKKSLAANSTSKPHSL